MELNPRQYLDPEGILIEEHILQCPGCRAWQLHYTDESVLDLLTWQRGGDNLLHPNYRQIEGLIEHLLARHLQQECRHPEIVHELWKQAGRPHL